MQIFENKPLRELLYYKIGGPARYVLTIEKSTDVDEAIAFIKEKNIHNILPVGLGANLLIHESPFEGAVLWFCHGKKEDIRDFGEGVIEVFAGTSLADVTEYGFAHNLIGLEWAGGLPSTIGAAIRGNAGAFGGEMKDVIERVTVLERTDNELTQRVLMPSDLQFGYRNSLVKQNKNLIIISARLQMKHLTDEAMVTKAQEVYEGNISYRQERHPVEYPSCGSVFKNIRESQEVEKMLAIWPDMQEQVKTKWYNKVSMGYTINRLGLSGMQVGGAQISPKHTNYIVNVSNAKFDDVVTLIETIKKKFHETFGFYPEPEVEIIS